MPTKAKCSICKEAASAGVTWYRGVGTPDKTTKNPWKLCELCHELVCKKGNELHDHGDAPYLYVLMAHKAVKKPAKKAKATNASAAQQLMKLAHLARNAWKAQPTKARKRNAKSVIATHAPAKATNHSKKTTT